MPKLTRRQHFEMAESILERYEDRTMPADAIQAVGLFAIAHATLAAIPVGWNTPEPTPPEEVPE